MMSNIIIYYPVGFESMHARVKFNGNFIFIGVNWCSNRVGDTILNVFDFA